MELGKGTSFSEAQRRSQCSGAHGTVYGDQVSQEVWGQDERQVAEKEERETMGLQDTRGLENQPWGMASRVRQR